MSFTEKISTVQEKKLSENSNDSCQDLIIQIKRGGGEREKATRELYEKYFGFVYDLARKYKIQLEDVLSIYNEAVAELIFRIDENRFEIQAPKSCSNFVYQVAKYKCMDWNKKQNRLFRDEDEDELDEKSLIIEPGKWEQQDRELFLEFLGKLGPTCQQVLLDWAEGYNMAEIAKRARLSDAHTASVTKYKCLKKLTKMVKEFGF